MKLDDVKYWIWLQLALGAGSRVDKIFRVYDTAEQIYFSTPSQRKSSGCFNVHQLRKMETADINFAQTIKEMCLQRNWGIITPGNYLYPKRLSGLRDYPLVLYTWGELPVIDNEFCIGMVGTRKPSEYALDISRKLSASIAKVGAVVISGGAVGIDTSAHEGALSVNGRTVLVLGCGLGTDYLRVNSKMRENIAHTGCVISEFAPFTPASRYTFPVRNRIISGLSQGVVIIEAAMSSGALITAKNAMEQGKDIFVTTGDIRNSQNDGVKWLIKDGAKPIFNVMDILEEYNLADFPNLNLQYADKKLNDVLPSEPINKKGETEEYINNTVGGNSEKMFHLENLSQDAVTVLECVKQGEVHIDDVCRCTGLAANRVLALMTELEIEGLVEPLSGRRFRC